MNFWQLCHSRLKIAAQGLAFSVFLWDIFSRGLYCDSCPLTVRITSPGTCSSSRDHRGCRPTPFPLWLSSPKKLFKQCKLTPSIIRDGFFWSLILPLPRSVGLLVSFSCSSAFHRIQGTFPFSAFRKLRAQWELSIVIACQNTQRWKDEATGRK